MNKLITLLFALFLFNNCSFNEKSKIWNKKEKSLFDSKTILKGGYMFPTNKWGPAIDTTRRDLIDGTIDSLIHAVFTQSL